MSSPILNSAEFALVADKMHAVDAAPALAEQTAPDAGTLLTVRAIVAVTLFGAAFWYVLWKVALHFWMMR